MFLGNQKLELVQVAIFELLIFQASLTMQTNQVSNSESTISHSNNRTNRIPIDDNVHEFVSKLISNSFSNCNLLVVQDKNDHSQNVNKLMSSLQHNVYMINFSPSSDLDEGESNATNKHPIYFSTSLSKTRRISDFCSLALIFVDDVNTKFIQQLQQVIAPTFLPIIRKDEDHFIFITRPDYHEKLLLMNELPSRVKFKIAIGRLDNGKCLITTVDLFGGTMGSPVMKHFPESFHKEVDYFPDFLWNLHGKVLKVSIPYTYSKVEAYLPWDSVNNGKRGNCKYLLEEYLMVKLNFTYSMFIATGMDGKAGAGGTGFQFPNGTWTGITGDLLYGRADIGLAMAHTEKRAQYIGHTDTYFDTGCLTFVTGQPSQVYSAFALFWPFNIFVWVTIIFVVLFSICFFFIVFYLAAHDCLYLKDSWPFTTQISILLSPFVEQDSMTPVSTPLRCFLIFWSFFAIIITTLYRSKLVTLLAFPLLIKIPGTFEQLAYSDFEVGFMKTGDSALNTFKASKDPVYVKLLQEMKVIAGVKLKCLETVARKKNQACIAYDFDVAYLRGKNLSDADSRKIISSNARTYNIWIGIGTEANSIYRINFGKVLGNTMPFHMVNIWDKMDMYYVKLLKLRWWAETNQTKNAKEDDAQDLQNLTLKHIKGSFYMILCGISLSFMFLCYELIGFQYLWFMPVTKK